VQFAESRIVQAIRRDEGGMMATFLGLVELFEGRHFDSKRRRCLSFREAVGLPAILMFDVNDDAKSEYRRVEVLRGQVNVVSGRRMRGTDCRGDAGAGRACVGSRATLADLFAAGLRSVSSCEVPSLLADDA
jgi:hypothetical protein